MMRALAQSFAPRPYVLRGRTYWLRPPMVGEAITLFATLEGALQGEPSHVDIFLRTLRGWLLSCHALRVYDDFRVLVGGGVPATVVPELMALIGDGAPKDGGGGKKMTLREIVEAPWDAAVRDYAYAFAREPHLVLLSTPWPFFLLAMGWADMKEAAEDLRQMHTAGLPYIKSPEKRRKAVGKLRRRAKGIRSGSKREKKPTPDKVDYKANIKRMERYRPLPTKKKDPNPSPNEPPREDPPKKEK